MTENGPQVNALFMKPFALGWTREVVRRVVTREKTPNCDIYYISPSKKKFRSMNEIKSSLTDGLSLECFSFKKEPLGLEPNLETIRDAKSRPKGVQSVRGKGLRKTGKSDTPEQKVEGDVKQEKTATEEEVSKLDVQTEENGNTTDTNIPEENADVKNEADVNLETKSKRGKPDGKELDKSKNVSNRKKVNGKPANLTRSVRLQALKRKKVIKRMMSAKQAKQSKVVPGRKVLKKIIRKKISVTGRGRKLSKSPNLKKSGLKNKTNISVKLKSRKKPLKSHLAKAKNDAAKESETNETDKRTRDLKSIVKKNIGKYREMREKQKLGVVKGPIKSPSRRSAVSRASRNDPISNNQSYLKPLEEGWRRELVFRSNSTKEGQLADVYYLHPSGKKLRSCREIAKNLTHGLSLDCFTFRKEPIGCGEPSEIIRNARPFKRTELTERKKNWR